MYLYYRLEFLPDNEGPLRFQILFGQVSNCGIIGGEELALLGNLELLIENVNGWEVKTSFCSWNVEGIRVYWSCHTTPFLQELIARASRFLSI